MFVEKMSALDIELILETLRTCGATLRHEEPEHLRYIFTTIKTRAQNNVDIISRFIDFKMTLYEKFLEIFRCLPYSRRDICVVVLYFWNNKSITYLTFLESRSLFLYIQFLIFDVFSLEFNTLVSGLVVTSYMLAIYLILFFGVCLVAVLLRIHLLSYVRYLLYH